MGTKKIIFLTGTRADFGKLKPLMHKLQDDTSFEVDIFVTGMHMLSKYGSTWEEVYKNGFTNIYRFVNQNQSDSMDHVLAKTVIGLSDYVKEAKPDLLVIHGDRVEALAGAIVGALNNISVAHIEGGEVSGTVDELIRHSISKLSHIHFTSNESAKNRLIQLGESLENIYVIGSPDIDIMFSEKLPNIEEVKKYYDISFGKYSILLFHSVTTELDLLAEHVENLVTEVIKSDINFIVISPNNDPGSDLIFKEYERFKGNSKIKLFPSMRFEYFLTALRNCQFIIGNSSAGIREAPYYNIPTINLGSRQLNRSKSKSIINVRCDRADIAQSIEGVISQSNEFANKKSGQAMDFGLGNSAELFYGILRGERIWGTSKQKYFIDAI